MIDLSNCLRKFCLEGCHEILMIPIVGGGWSRQSQGDRGGTSWVTPLTTITWSPPCLDDADDESQDDLDVTDVVSSEHCCCSPTNPGSA